MKPKELKKVLKPLIRECLMEIFAEVQIENIIKKVLQENAPIAAQQIQREQPRRRVVNEYRTQPSSEEVRRSILDKVKMTDAEQKSNFASYYEGVDVENNPIITGESSNPEHVSDRDLQHLQNLGLLKSDYSGLI